MPALIEAQAVSKRFRQHRRFPGLLGALKTLVTAEYTEGGGGRRGVLLDRRR